MAKTLKEAKEALAAKQKAYHELVAEQEKHMTARHEASRAVRDAQKELSDVITEGAMPCPKCKQMPRGMEQPGQKGGTTYEVGCITPTCKPFKHTDGTTREYRVFGGLLPKHTVEAWNAGPDHWKKAPPPPENPDIKPAIIGKA